jgi:hypothetical protein
MQSGQGSDHPDDLRNSMRQQWHRLTSPNLGSLDNVEKDVHVVRTHGGDVEAAAHKMGFPLAIDDADGPHPYVRNAPGQLLQR